MNYNTVTNRNVALCIVLSLVTCGIYALYWMVCLANDVNTATQKVEGRSGGMVLLLSLITCNIYWYYWLFKAGESMDRERSARGEPTGSLSVIYLILAILGLGIVSMALLQNELNNSFAA